MVLDYVEDICANQPKCKAQMLPAMTPFMERVRKAGLVVAYGTREQNMTKWLKEVAPAPGDIKIVNTAQDRFYNTDLDNYFITADPNEQEAVSNGAAGPGWAATGNRFSAGGPLKVCRFYGSITPGPNSHFYTIDPQECQALKNLQASTPITQKRWNFESNDFSSSPSANQQCAGDLIPVYRAYNNGAAKGIDSNHRITASQAGIAEVVAKGWTSEGVVMCAVK
jgi:hypothetical protein